MLSKEEYKLVGSMLGTIFIATGNCLHIGSQALFLYLLAFNSIDDINDAFWNNVLNARIIQNINNVQII